MKNYIFDEVEFSAIVLSRLETYYKIVREKLLTKNPTFCFTKVLTQEQEKIVKLYQAGMVKKEEISEKDLSEIEDYFKEAQEVSIKVQSGEMETEFFSKEELKKLLFITEEEFNNCIIDGKKE
jgi:predicted DNA-binding protein